MNVPDSLGNQYSQTFYIFVRYIGFTPDVQLVMESKETAVKDIRFSLCCAGY